MVRFDMVRRFISEVSESPEIEKISFILPFFVVAIDVILIEHAVRINEHYIIVLTTTLFILSVLEIIVVIREIHKHRQDINFEQVLTIQLDDFVMECNQKNVKNIVQNFIKKYPEYEKYRNEVYHITCKIMEAHKKKL